MRNKRRCWNDHGQKVDWAAVRRQIEEVQTRMFEVLDTLAKQNPPVAIVHIEPGGERGTHVYPIVHVGLLHRSQDRNRKIRQLTFGDRPMACLQDPRMEEFEPAGNMWIEFLRLFPGYDVRDLNPPTSGVIRYKITPNVTSGKTRPLAGIH